MDKRKRIYILDEIRGICIILMIIYHSLYNLTHIFNFNIPFFYSNTMEIIRLSFVFTFIVIAGIMCNYSRNNLKRGLICFGSGMIITIFTKIFIPEQYISFGILHFMGISMIIYFILEKVLNKIFYLYGIFFSILFFILSYKVNNRIIGIPSVFTVSIPNPLYNTEFLFPLGFASQNFFSADYYPVFPWFFLFLSGVYLGKLMKSRNIPDFFYKIHSKILKYIGNHSLLIYLLHQPLIYGLMSIFFNL